MTKRDTSNIIRYRYQIRFLLLIPSRYTGFIHYTGYNSPTQLVLQNILFYYIMDSCPICLDHISSKENFISLPCTHTFHANCLLHWLTINHQCPCCRKSCGEKLNVLPSFSFSLFPQILDTQIDIVTQQILIAHYPWRFAHMKKSKWNSLSHLQKTQKIRKWIIDMHRKSFDNITSSSFFITYDNSSNFSNNYFYSFFWFIVLQFLSFIIRFLSHFLLH